MIIEYQEYSDKLKTRPLYEEAFDDPREFVDYYYEDKILDNRMIVSLENDEVVSMLHLNPYKINLCGTIVPTYYVVAVATRKDRHHQGHMSKVFDKTFEILKNENIPFVFLLPVDESIYSWMGFETICDFTVDRIPDYQTIMDKFDVYCIRDEAYTRRMSKEDALREMDNGEVLPDNPVIMGKITSLQAFDKAVGKEFVYEKEAIKWLKSKRIYICEEV
ncbi:GNAT family N-acetyltransferase [Butyrivibrio sp. VCB2006]|uniref:GNAT family N-acetyltransferase n=1 Tax=Butyrivibrio sp. VCB2006 TaxID=1280679 RepID=UPI0003F87666|nr:GNAT family N-acetyltransferase [Butyrivibrio sp. VCB2006]